MIKNEEKKATELHVQNHQNCTEVLIIANNSIEYSQEIYLIDLFLFTFPGFSVAKVIIIGLTSRAVNGRLPQI